MVKTEIKDPPLSLIWMCLIRHFVLFHHQLIVHNPADLLAQHVQLQQLLAILATSAEEFVGHLQQEQWK